MANEKKYTPPVSDELGRKAISHYMSRKVVCATPSSTIAIAIQIMLNHQVSGIPVCDDMGRCVGVYSELDAMIQGASQPLDSKIKFTTSPYSAKPDDTFHDVLVLMVKRRIRRIPVLDTDHTLLGIVSRRDLMKALFESNQKK